MTKRNANGTANRSSLFKTFDVLLEKIFIKAKIFAKNNINVWMITIEVPIQRETEFKLKNELIILEIKSINE